MSNENIQDPVTELIDKLTPEQQEDLRRRLNFKVWSRRFDQINSIIEGDRAPADQITEANLGQKFAALVQQMIDDVESPEANQLLLPGMIRQTWQQVLQSVKDQPDFSDIESASPGTMEQMLEQSYQDLQDQLIEIRNAVAQAIATEKHLDQQLQKNRDQAQTWRNRADMAIQQNNLDLEEQARLRAQQFQVAAEELELQASTQKQSTNKMRNMLTNLEGEVQKAYTKKVVLMARDKAASATLAVNDLLSGLDPAANDKLLVQLEKVIAEKEQKAGNCSFAIDPTPTPDVDTVIAKAIDSIDRLTEAVARIERHVVKREAAAKEDKPTE